MSEGPVEEQPKQPKNVVNLNFWRENQSPEPARHNGHNGHDIGGGGPPPGPPEGPPPPDDGEGPQPTWASDDALALQLAGLLHGDWYYVVGWDEWVYWEGQLWERSVGEVVQHIRKMCRWVSARIDKAPSLARSVSGGRTISNVERLARSDERLLRKTDEFDVHSHLLNTPGGIVDLNTGELYAHDKRQLMTQMAGAGPEGDCPVWRRFLSELTGGDQAYQDYLQRLVGYSLTGSTEEEMFAFLYGPSNTGKSKFVETVRSLHGTYGCAASMDTFIATQNHGHLTEIARFVGKRLVTAAETDENCRWDQQRMTTLTGRDEITANFMRQDQFSFYPRFLLMFHGNHRPRLSSDGGAMRRRMHLLPIRHRPAKIDKHLIDKLKAELGGVMRWAVEGAVLWRQHGLMPPPIVTQATEDYFVTEDILSTWIDERCDRDRSFTSRTRELYADYVAWSKATNEYVLSEKRFAEALLNLGFERWRHPQNRRMGFAGLQLKGHSDELGV